MSRYKKENSLPWQRISGNTVQVISIFLLAVLFRLCLVWYLLGLDWWYNSGEGYEHTLLADYLLSDQCYMPPGQYLFAGAINQWFGQPAFLLLRLATIFLSALTSVNIYRIGRDSFGMVAGVAAGYLSCISLSFAFHSWTFYPTMLATALFSFFMVHFFRILDYPKRKNALLAGLFLGLSILTRSEMVLFLPVSLFWFFLVRGIKRENVLVAGAVLLVCSMVIAFWSFRNYAACDRFVFISANAPVNYFIGNNPIQKGNYFPPQVSNEQKDDYLLAGVTYDIEHPGWFVKYFAEKFKLCWSRETWEHPLHLMQSRFERSTIKLFNDSFPQSRLSAALTDAHYDTIYRRITAFYSLLIDMFWLFVLAGVLSGHVLWRKSYFLLMLCFTTTVVLSLFISGSQRWSVPVLPCFYLLMGSGIVFCFRVFRLTRSEITLLLRRNAFIVGAVIIAYCAWQALLTSYPAERKEIIRELYPWNVFSTGGVSVRLIIMESQLAYPVKSDALRRDTFSVRIGSYEIPHLEVAGTERTDEKYYFKRVKDLLCKNAIVINIPNALMGTFMRPIGSENEEMKAHNIIQALQGTITVSYIPAWQFCSVVEKSCDYVLERLTMDKVITPDGQRL